MKARDLYADLGVTPTATDAEIKAAYRRLALQHHPDRNPRDPQAPVRFRVVSEAYQVLSDPVKRRQYDGARQQGGRAAAEFWRDFPDMVSSAMPDLAELRAAVAGKLWRQATVAGVNTIFNIFTIANTVSKYRKAKKAGL